MSTVAQPLDSRDERLPLGVRDVLSRASEGWLKNTEVCDLLVHFRTYGLPVCRHPPSQPAGGSVFLFDRRAVRFFRKDGHSWRKKADGKTVRETHEKLKVGNVDMLNCYYAHGDDSEDVRLQRRCYWLLEADEDIVLVHYLSAHQMTGGPRSKGPTSRAAASHSTSDEPDVSEGTPTTSSDGSGLRQRHSLESPFLAKARIANAQNQAAIASAIASRNAAADVYGGAVAPPRPQIGPNLRPRTASQLAPLQQAEQSQMPAPQRLPLSGRPAAIAAAAAGHPAYSSSISKNDSTLIEGHMPLLPSMSMDSFFNLVDHVPSTTGVPAAAPQAPKMQRQGSDPLRLESLVNQWDEDGAIPMLHGHLPSLHMNPSLQANSIAMQDLDAPAGLAGSSLRLPSGVPEGYASFLRGSTTATQMRAPGLKTLSGLLPRMHVVASSDRGSMDFEHNRSFTVRPPTPVYGGEDSPASLSGLAGAEHLQGGWDPTSSQHGLPSWEKPWDSMANAPAHVPVPPPPPQRAPALLLHQGGQRPPQVAQHLAPPPFYSPFAQGGLQHHHHQQQQSTPSPHPAAMQQAQQQEALVLQQSGAMARQHSDALARQHSDAMARQQSAQLQAMQAARGTLPPQEAPDAAAHFQLGRARTHSRGPQTSHGQASDLSGATGMVRHASGALRGQASDAAGMSMAKGAAPTTWVPDSGAEDVGGSKAARRAGGSALALEAELNTLQRNMLTSWQAPPLGAQQAPPPPPLGQQVPAWQAQLESLETRAAAPGMQRQRSAGVASTGGGCGGGLSGAEDEVAQGPAGERARPSAFRVTDFSPEWDSTAGGAKMILTGSLLPGAPLEAQRGPLFLLFDQTEVPATVLQAGVLRAMVPPHAPGTVRLAVSLGDGVPRSRPLHFEYRVPLPPQPFDDNRLELKLSDRELQLRLVRMLLDGRAPGSWTSNSPEYTSMTSTDGGQQQGQQRQQTALQDGQQHDTQQERQHEGQQPQSPQPTGGAAAYAAASPASVPDEQRARYLTLLLQREVQRHSAQAQEAAARGAGKGGLDRASDSGLALLHLFAALGWEWGITALLLAGADCDVRDAWGRTPLHWAASRGHEAAVTALLARKAKPSPLTWAAAGRAPATPADLAAANGHAGLAAFLGEALLSQLLLRLKPESRRDALAAAAAAANEGDSEGPGHRKRTRAQRSLYPGDAAAAGEDADGLFDVHQAASALQEAYSKVAQRRAARRERRSQLRQRDVAAAQRIEQWQDVWRMAEGRTVGATSASVQPFGSLVGRASRLGSTLRGLLLTEGGEDSRDDSGEDSRDTGSTSLLHADPAVDDAHKGCLEKAVAYVEAMEGNETAAAAHRRLTDARTSAAGSQASAKFSRSQGATPPTAAAAAPPAAVMTF